MSVADIELRSEQLAHQRLQWGVAANREGAAYGTYWRDVEAEMTVVKLHEMALVGVVWCCWLGLAWEGVGWRC